MTTFRWTDFHSFFRQMTEAFSGNFVTQTQNKIHSLPPVIHIWKLTRGSEKLFYCRLQSSTACKLTAWTIAIHLTNSLAPCCNPPFKPASVFNLLICHVNRAIPTHTSGWHVQRIFSWKFLSTHGQPAQITDSLPVLTCLESDAVLLVLHSGPITLALASPLLMLTMIHRLQSFLAHAWSRK